MLNVALGAIADSKGSLEARHFAAAFVRAHHDEFTDRDYTISVERAVDLLIEGYDRGRAAAQPIAEQPPAVSDEVPMTLAEFKAELEAVRTRPYRWEEEMGGECARFCAFIDELLKFAPGEDRERVAVATVLGILRAGWDSVRMETDHDLRPVEVRGKMYPQGARDMGVTFKITGRCERVRDPLPGEVL